MLGLDNEKTEKPDPSGEQEEMLQNDCVSVNGYVVSKVNAKMAGEFRKDLARRDMLLFSFHNSRSWMSAANTAGDQRQQLRLASDVALRPNTSGKITPQTGGSAQAPVH